MELIRDVGVKKYGKRNYMFSIFECPDCLIHLERRKDVGRSSNTCPDCARKRQTEAVTTHGETGTTLFNKWCGMRERCGSPTSERAKYYHDKGIRVCEEWGAFSVFKEWAEATGYEKGLCIDRIDPAKNYSPDNCQWLTNKENLIKMHKDKGA